MSNCFCVLRETHIHGALFVCLRRGFCVRPAGLAKVATHAFVSGLHAQQIFRGGATRARWWQIRMALPATAKIVCQCGGHTVKLESALSSRLLITNVCFVLHVEPFHAKPASVRTGCVMLHTPVSRERCSPRWEHENVSPFVNASHIRLRVEIRTVPQNRRHLAQCFWTFQLRNSFETS